MKKANNYLNRDFKKRRSKDKISKIERSILMSKIRSKNTNFERSFIILLKKATRKKFETNVTTIKGKPDIVFYKQRLCIFLDSDFWHGWQYPRWKHLLKNDFWRKKLENNRRRDRITTSYLRKNKWIVLRFWEHNINRDLSKIIQICIFYLKPKR